MALLHCVALDGQCGKAAVERQIAYPATADNWRKPLARHDGYWRPTVRTYLGRNHQGA